MRKFDDPLLRFEKMVKEKNIIFLMPMNLKILFRTI